jgi:UDP-GlcNAc3NAcA epimerase
MIHTGQHFDRNMSEIFFTELGIRNPDYHLGIHGMSHGAMTGRMLEEIEKVLLQRKPDMVLVYGDTDSTLAGALAAAKLHIPIAHVEAGLRAFNQDIPEEINRVLTDHISTILFTPTDQADKNLVREGIDQKNIFQVGDVMYDATLYFSAKASDESHVLAECNADPHSYFLATIHRPQNTDTAQSLKKICALLEAVAESKRVIWPVHPRAKKQLGEFGIQLRNVQCIEPVGYLDMIELERNAALILTDSGGVQKEAYFHRVPCVTLRPETEWVELVEHGWNILLPLSGDVQSMAVTVLHQAGKRGKEVQLYGSGQASEKIAEMLSTW